MTKTLKQRLNQLPEDVNHRIRFEYPVEARAQYELVRRYQEGRATDLHPYCAVPGGIVLPTEELARLIWVPQFMLKHDASGKERNPGYGIQLFTPEANAFMICDSEGRPQQGVWNEDLVKWSCEMSPRELITKLATDPETQAKALAHSKAKLFNNDRGDRAYWTSSKASKDGKKLNKLVFSLREMYAKEMGVTLSQGGGKE